MLVDQCTNLVQSGLAMQSGKREASWFGLGIFILCTLLALVLTRSFVVLIYAHIFALILLLLSFFSVKWHLTKNAEQHARAKDHEDPFFLLLRPFNIHSYQRMVYKHVSEGHWSEGIEHFSFQSSDNLIAKLERATRGKSLLVTVGDSFSTEDLPADHDMLILHSEESQWQPMVQVLAKFSQTIILMPYTSLGVFEEMKMIERHHLWKKTVMIIPPLYQGHEVIRIFRGTYIYEGQERKDWETVRHKLMEHGYIIPESMDSGMICAVNSNFSARATIYPKSWDQSGLSEAFDAISPYIEGEWLPFKDVYKLLEPSVCKTTFGLREILLGLSDRSFYRE
jgi:hypothetical protein